MRTFSPHGFCLAIVVGLVAMFGNSGLAQYSPGKFIVVLDGDSAASSYLAAKPGRLPGAAAQSARTRAAQIRAQHDAFSVQFKSMGAAELSRHSKLLNAITIRATDAQIGAIKKLPGVKSVHRSRLYELNTASSVPFIGAPAVWSGITNADGNGIRIGIIDTGIDYTHADFGGPGNPSDYSSNDRNVIEPGTFPTAKIVGGYDFVGDVYNARSNNSNTPVPDADPMDCAGHGSHVAGIAAGFGVLTNGATFNGPYTNGMAFTQFMIGPGVAPRALLYALKVFGCSGSTDDEPELQAIEWAADPNNDMDFSDHLDAVNMSLGSQFGFTGNGLPVQDALNMLANLGCVPVLSAGNTYDTFYNVGSPSTAEKAISVACSIDDGTTTDGLQVKSPASIATRYVAVEGAITAPLSQSGPKEGLLVYTSPANACSSIDNSDLLPGNIALIDRGNCNFSDKILRAQASGAIAVVMVNNVAGAPTAMGGSGTGISIPGVMITQSDGASLKAHLSENIIVRLGPDTGIVHPELTDRITDFSSRGPAAPNSLLKPEIAAPGYTITSVKVGGGTIGTDMSGTSMSAPHVTGAAGLLRQLQPTWSVEEIKAALMNTAVGTHDAAGNAYPESRTGAGRIQLDAAARATVTARAENSGGLVSLSFGALMLTNTYTVSRNIVLTNHSAVDVNYSIAISNTVSENGASLTSPVNNVTVPAHGSALVPVQLTANPSLFDRTPDLTTTNIISGSPRQFLYEVSGEVWFQNSNLSIHLPYYANVRSGSAYQSGITNLSFAISNNPITISVPLSGFSTHPQPLVSAFQLALISSNQMLGPLETSADLLAVGVASDASQQSQFTNTTIYFAVASAADWSSPTPVLDNFTIQIDTNADRIFDIQLFNNSLGNNGFYSDVFETAVINSNGSSTVWAFINGFSAAQRDTAPFNNNVLVMPIPVRALGLVPDRSQFNYRVVTSGYVTNTTETTPWLTFDAAHPVLDTALYGISGKPFFADGATLRIKADPNAAYLNGSSPGHAGLMLLHHFNATSNRLELIDIRFGPQFLPPQTQGSRLVLNWTSASSAVYTLQYATNLDEGFVFLEATGISATPPVNSYPAARDSTVSRYYRLKQD